MCLFGLLFGTALFLIRTALPEGAEEGAQWLDAGSQRMKIAAILMPFAGIAFLWFIGVVRDGFGRFEDKFFSSVFIGAGLMFLAMVFVASAIGAGLVASSRDVVDVSAHAEVATFGQMVLIALTKTYALRMARRVHDLAGHHLAEDRPDATLAGHRDLRSGTGDSVRQRYQYVDHVGVSRWVLVVSVLLLIAGRRDRPRPRRHEQSAYIRQGTTLLITIREWTRISMLSWSVRARRAVPRQSCWAAVGYGLGCSRRTRIREHYKRLCTHSIRSSALPTIRRLGLDIPTWTSSVQCATTKTAWTKCGWVHERVKDARARLQHPRVTLDPFMRATAAAVPGVELMMGARVRDLTRDGGGRSQAVSSPMSAATQQTNRGRLVVGADGYTSKVAELAGLPGRVSANKRFGYQAGYQNVELPPGWTGAIWYQEPRVNVNAIFCNNDGVAMLAAFHLKDRLADFKRDRDAALLGSFASLADAPDLSGARRVTDFIGTADYPSITRRHMVRPGVALVGDAAMVGDPTQGVGCGWAFQSAEWLAEAVTDPLTSGGNKEIDAGARRYQRKHRRTLLPHQRTNIQFSQSTTLNPLLRTIYGAAARDQRVADRLTAVATRNSSPLTLLDPILLTRAAIARRKPVIPVRSSAPATGRA